MARERYLLNDEEDSIHSNIIIPTTKKDKMANWWYYSRVKLFVIGVVLIFVGAFIYSYVTKIIPDYNIAITSENYYNPEFLELVEIQLEEYADDRNNDGVVDVQILDYSIVYNEDGTPYDPNTQQVALVKLTADMTTGDSVIWLHDQMGYYMLGDETEGLFEDIGGEEDPTMIDFNDVLAFDELDFSSYEGTEYDPEKIEELFGELRVSFRVLMGAMADEKENVEGYPSQQVFFDNLYTGTKRMD